jgi:hypothetical protein
LNSWVEEWKRATWRSDCSPADEISILIRQNSEYRTCWYALAIAPVTAAAAVFEVEAVVVTLAPVMPVMVAVGQVTCRQPPESQ